MLSLATENEHKSESALEAKNIVTKIIEAKMAGENLLKKKSIEQKFVPQEIRTKEKNEKFEEKRSRGRPRKPIDPEELQKPKRPKGRPRKPIDEEELNKPKRPRGRPRKPIDPEELQKPKRPKGRPRKIID